MKHFQYTRTDSTNTRAQALAALNPGQALLVSARTQTQGRGRTGRPWASPAGGAWLTLVWPVREGVPAETYAAAPLAAGLAILRTLEPLVPDAEALTIKWPNDVLLAGAKVAGLLCERVVPAAAAGSAVKPAGPVLLIGVGVNANVEPAELGPSLGVELRYPAISLRAHTGQAADLAALTRALGAALAKAMRELEAEGFMQATREAIEARLAWRDEPVTLQDGQTTRTGLCRGIDERGALLLEINGVRQAFEAGEVHGLSPAAV